MPAAAVAPDFIERLKSAVGPAGVVDDPAAMAPYLTDWRGLYHGRAGLVLRPAATAEVAAVMRACAEAGVGVVPQGGNTGMVGGSVPDAGGASVVLSLSRMNRIREVDPLNFTMTAEAGCVLKALQDAAEAAGLLLPLSLAAEGSCQIGGNLATNAGGTAVLRYGTARELVLGLEVVLPDGRIWDGLSRLRKDNTGYDLKQLFLGAEGTLGVITAAVLKLFPRPLATETALIAVRDPAAATRLLARLRTASGDAVTSFEYIHRAALEVVLAHIPDTADPFQAPHRHYVLVELAGAEAGAALRAALEATLAEALDAGEVLDAVIADSGAQAQRLWRLREAISEAQAKAGPCIKHDVSVPVSRVAEFLERAGRAVAQAMPEAIVMPFGHVGDGNVHFNLTLAPGGDGDAFLAQTEAVAELVHDVAVALDGSFSAEHGIGVMKRAALRHYKSSVELDLMRRIKTALDPKGIMNPGKLL